MKNNFKNKIQEPIKLQTWFLSRIRVPILILFLSIMCLQALYFIDLQKKNNQLKLNSLDNSATSISIAINQNNRQLLESLLELALREAGGENISICDDNKTLISYPNETTACNNFQDVKLSVFSQNFSIRKKIFNDSALSIVVDGKTNHLLYYITISTLFSCILMILSFLTLNQIKKRVKTEIIEGLLDISQSNNNIKITEIEEIKSKQSELNKIKTDQAITSAMYNTCTQVAHDIKSPIAALETAISFKDPNCDTELKNFLINSSIKRIKEIANNLLIQNKNFTPGLTIKEITKEIDITELVNEIILEKKAEHLANTNLKIEYSAIGNLEKVANVNEASFKRVLSNLINNAIEATHNQGLIKVKLTANNEFNELSISDNGIGIPTEILNSLFKRGFSFNKENGNGLGLFHAKECIERWNGKIFINTKINIGTEVVLQLPLSKISSNSLFDSKLS